MGVDKTTSLEIFKTKISECIEMVGLMGPHERISAVEIWNEISGQLQEVINNAIEELEILEQCYEKEKENLSLENKSKLENPIIEEHPYTLSSDPYTLVIPPPSVTNKSPVKVGTSLLKQPEQKISQSVLINGQTIILNSDDKILNGKDPSDTGLEEELEINNLSGQVLIVPGDHENNDRDSEDVSDNHHEDARTVTVTGEDGVSHQIQFGLSSIEPIEEDPDNMDEDDPLDLKKPQVITADMARTKTVTVNEAPEAVDETPNKVVRAKADGSTETVFQCELCSKMFATAASLTSHRWQHTKPFQCEQCKVRFASKGNLVIHRRRHTGDRPFDCHICESKFTTKGNLKRHIQSHSGVKPWACTQCDGKFTEKKSLKIHMRKHTGEKPYACKFCGKKFAQTSILKSHVAMHLDKRSHLCDLCGRGFRQKSQLRMHVQRHAGVKKFDCSYCESKFLTKADLERHIKSHMGQRDFACTLCSKTFTRQQTLNEHLNRHYGLKPFECKLCGKTFSEMSAVYKHVKTHDNTKSETQAHEEIIFHKVQNPITIEGPQLDDPDDGIMNDVVINIDDKVISINNDKTEFIYLDNLIKKPDS